MFLFPWFDYGIDILKFEKSHFLAARVILGDFCPLKIFFFAGTTMSKSCVNLLSGNIFWYSGMQATFFFKRGFDKKFTFAAISSLLRVVWPQFFYWRTPWMSRSILNTYIMGLRCDLAPTQPFKVRRLTKNSSKLNLNGKNASQDDILRILDFAILSCFELFVVKRGTLNGCVGARSHRKPMI